jgi:hypothetical protein
MQTTKRKGGNVTEKEKKEGEMQWKWKGKMKIPAKKGEYKAQNGP